MQTKYDSFKTFLDDLSRFVIENEDFLVVDNVNVIRSAVEQITHRNCVFVSPNENADYTLIYYDGEIIVKPLETADLDQWSFDIALIHSDELKPGSIKAGVCVYYEV